MRKEEVKRDSSQVQIKHQKRSNGYDVQRKLKSDHPVPDDHHVYRMHVSRHHFLRNMKVSHRGQRRPSPHHPIPYPKTSFPETELGEFSVPATE